MINLQKTWTQLNPRNVPHDHTGPEDICGSTLYVANITYDRIAEVIYQTV